MDRSVMVKDSTKLSVRDLTVWERGIELAVEISIYTRDFPADERYGLCSQLRRAAISISSNISEGCGRNSKGEFIHFLGIAKGSNNEVQTQLEIAKRLSYGSAPLRLKCLNLSVEIAKMLPALIHSLQRPKS